MSTKSIQKLLNQTINKKRKSCFEITRVAFQNLSEDETDDDDNMVGDSLPEKNSKHSRENISSRTRFKVLKTAYIRGRWNCSDSLENVEDDFHLVESGKCKRCNETENEQPVEVFQSSISVLNFPHCKTSIYSESLTVESSRNIPDLLDHQVNDSAQDILLHAELNCKSPIPPIYQSPENDGTLGHSSSLPSLSTIIAPDVTNECKNVINPSIEYLLDHHDRDIRIASHPKRTSEYFVDPLNTKNNLVLLNSSENISEKISKALDLAKEHVILTAHGEIERLKDKIIQLQSTIKRLEEENMQLRGLNIQQFEVPVTTDLIDLSDN